MDEVKKFRVENGLDQVRMAKIIGITQSAYSKKEDGSRPFKTNEIKAIEKHFNLSPLQVYDLFLKGTTV